MPPPKDPKKYAEWLQKNRESHLGKPSAFKGKTHTNESLEKQWLPKLGNTYRIGKKHSLESNQKNRERHLGKSTWMKGKNHTEQANEKNRIAHLGNTNRRGQKHRLDSIIKIKEARSKQIMPQFDTKIERIMQIALLLNNITFKKHKMIRSNDFFHQVDLFIEPNICVEIDGDYWHTLPHMIKRDNEVNQRLNELGYKVIRFWGKEVIKDAQLLVDFIQNFLKSRNLNFCCLERLYQFIL